MDVFYWESLKDLCQSHTNLVRSISCNRSSSVCFLATPPLLTTVLVDFSSLSVDASDEESELEWRLCRLSRSCLRCFRLRDRDRDLRLDFFLWWCRSRLRLLLRAILIKKYLFLFENRVNFNFFQLEKEIFFAKLYSSLNRLIAKQYWLRNWAAQLIYLTTGKQLPEL